MKRAATAQAPADGQSLARARRSPAAPPVASARSTPAAQAAVSWRLNGRAAEKTRPWVPYRASRLPSADQTRSGQIQATGRIPWRTALRGETKAAIVNPSATVHHHQ